MGCKSSKMPDHKIRVVQSAGTIKDRKRVSPASETELRRAKFASNPDIFSAKSSKSSLEKDDDSLFGNNDSRHSSAGSKVSKHSEDSGFDPNENAWENIITEESDPTLVQKIEEEFGERELDLCVQGTSVRQLKHELEEERREEKQILATLQREGLLVRPESRAQGGVSFEITEEPSAFPKRPPPRLEKLEMRRKKRKNRELTADEIRAKLERAEERRKRKEQERIERINATHRKEQEDVLGALEEFQEHQRRTEEGVFKRLGSASENREKRMVEMRDRLKAKREYEEMVRQRKKVAQEMGLSTTNQYCDEDNFENELSGLGQFDPSYDEDER